MTDALSRTKSSSYDLAGNLISTTDAKDQTTTYGYDNLNRIKTITKPGNVTVGYTYDDDSHKLTMTDSRGTTTYTYDILGELKSVATPDSKTVAYDYNHDGQRQTVTYPDQRTATYAYTDDGQLQSVTGPANDTTSYTYYADGSLYTTTLPNGIVTTDTYDHAGRLASVTEVLGGTTLLSVTYTRDEDGNPTTIDDSVAGQSTYTYNALDELTQETRTGTTVTYHYDPVGSRDSETVNGTQTISSFDAADELTAVGSTTYGYDANGSRTSMTSGSQTTTYTYNSDNLLTGISSPSITTSYVYDGANQRVSATENGSETDFVLDGGNVLQESTGNNATTYTYGVGLISRETASGITYLLTDDQGSVRLETDASGNVTQTRSYDAYGNELGSPTMAGNRFRYAGQWSDGSGLIFLRARFYDPQTGAFLSVDPVPRAASPYVYCNNNPLLLIDPSGMLSLSSLWSDLCSVGSEVWQGVKGGINCLAGALDSVPFISVGQPFHGPGLTASYRIGQYVVGPAAQIAAGGALAKALGCLGGEATGAAASAGSGARVAAGPGTSFFEGTQYSAKVLQQMESGVGEFHSFPEEVCAFESSGTVRSVMGGDGVVRQMLEIPGSYVTPGPEGTWYNGVFQFMKEADGTINHRMFVPGP